jgi:hypothetical protein
MDALFDLFWSVLLFEARLHRSYLMEIVLSHRFTVAAILAQLPTVAARVRLAVVCRAWAAAVRESAEIWRDLHSLTRTRRLADLMQVDLAQFQQAEVLLGAPRDVGLLETACARGRVDIAEWLADRHGFTIDDLAWRMDPLKLPLLTRLRGAKLRLETIKWVVARFGITKSQLIASNCLSVTSAQHSACIENISTFLPALDWLVTHFSLSRRNLSTWARGIFEEAAFQGCEEMVQWIASRRLIPADADAERILTDAGCEGHIGIAKVISAAMGITPTDMEEWQAMPFRTACKFGHLELAQWFFARFCVNRKHAVSSTNGNNYSSAMTLACEGGHLPTARWLVAHYDIRTEDILADNNCEPLLSAASRYCGDDAVKWLFTTFDLREKLGEVEEAARKSQKAELLQWLSQR